MILVFEKYYFMQNYMFEYNLKILEKVFWTLSQHRSNHARRRDFARM